MQIPGGANTWAYPHGFELFFDIQLNKVRQMLRRSGDLNFGQKTLLDTIPCMHVPNRHACAQQSKCVPYQNIKSKVGALGLLTLKLVDFRLDNCLNCFSKH